MNEVSLSAVPISQMGRKLSLWGWFWAAIWLAVQKRGLMCPELTFISTQSGLEDGVRLKPSLLYFIIIFNLAIPCSISCETLVP